MFEKTPLAPLDPILGLSTSYQQDTRSDKVNLGVGVYKNEQGITPVLDVVKKAESILLKEEVSKSYLPIAGLSRYTDLVTNLLLGQDHAVIKAQRVGTIQVPGGTGGLRVAADFLFHVLGAKRIWISRPTWANHLAIFKTVGFDIVEYDYYDKASHQLDFAKMKSQLQQAQSGDILLLHTCCHNPTGADLSLEQWSELVDLCRAQQVTPLFDTAYLGFHQGIEQDAQVLRMCAEKLPEMLIVNSFSKNFSLYNERIGTLSVITESADHLEAALSQMKRMARVLYSNPPAHGALIVAQILSDSALCDMWHAELKMMRERIASMRHLLVQALANNKAGIDFSFIEHQRGMFSFSGLSVEQVTRLRDEFGIYMTDSGRMSVAGISQSNVKYLADAINQVL
tara:strand:- start:735 stop:1925 length:1191 start_codon:yes stop_codon:yes gene_type:complete